jgi:hypothetical protein
MINDISNRYNMKSPYSVLYDPKLDPKKYSGRSRRLTNQIILPNKEFSRKLDKEAFNSLYSTIYHEMLHLNAPEYQEIIDYWYQLFTGKLGPYHKDIYDKEFKLVPPDDLYENSRYRPCK